MFYYGISVEIARILKNTGEAGDNVSCCVRLNTEVEHNLLYFASCQSGLSVVCYPHSGGQGLAEP